MVGEVSRSCVLELRRSSNNYASRRSLVKSWRRPQAARHELRLLPLAPLPYRIRKCKLRYGTCLAGSNWVCSCLLLPFSINTSVALGSICPGSATWLTPYPLSRGIMSVNERRTSQMGASRPRVASNRVDAEKAALRAAASPIQSENMDQLRDSASSQKSRASRDQQNITTSEKRTERTTINTREKVQVRTRNPVKESASAGNRGDWEKLRMKRASQTDGAVSGNARKKEKEPAER